MIANAESDLAAIGAMRAGGGNIFHFPGTGFVTVRATGERADGADVDAHAALFALQMILAVRNDYAVSAAHAYAKRLHVHTFIADAHATEAQDASRSVVV